MGKPRIDRYMFINRTNTPGTCRWCGVRVSPSRGYVQIDDGGPYHFCSLACVELFAAAIIKNNHQLVPFTGAPWGKGEDNVE